MQSRPVLRTLTIVGLGAAGLVGGHTLGYALAVPDGYHRAALLEVTGHGYLPSASQLALMFGIAAVVAGIVSGYLHRPASVQPRWPTIAVRLALLQCAGFVALELVERALASAPMSTLSFGLVVIGLLAQLVVACVSALLVVGLRRLGGVLRSSGRFVPVGARGRFLVASDPAPVSRSPVGERVRGPPAPAVV